MMPYCTAVAIIGSCAVADPGEGPGEPLPPLCLDQTENRRAEKCFLRSPPPHLSQGLDESPSPPLSEGLDPPLLCTAMRICLSFLSNIFSFKGESVYVLYIFVDEFLIFLLRFAYQIAEEKNSSCLVHLIK